jgi:membrane protease YdiL (CAAX protease family)
MKSKILSKFANVWGFFAAVYAVAWLIWLPALLQQGDEPNLPLLVLGAFVPSVMGIIFTYLSKGREERRDFWLRVIDVRRIGWHWLLVIALIYPMLYGLAALLFAALGGTPPSPAAIGRALLSPGLMLQLVVANLIVSGFSEELGWRGYALDPLQNKWSALKASLVLGLVHGFWHTPLFLISGITQGEMGLFSIDYFLFLLVGIAGAVPMTWIYNNTGCSILAAVLLHFFTNLTLDLITGLQGALPTGYMAILAAVFVLTDVLIVAVWGAETLTGGRRSETNQELAAADNGFTTA